MSRLKVTFLHRKPYRFYFSMEVLFSMIRKELSDKIEPTIVTSSFYSKGIIRRIYNVFEAKIKQGSINHITGDINYIALLMNGSKTVLTIHDCGYLETNNSIKREVLRLFWLTIPCNKVKYITTVSEATKQYLLSNVKIKDPSKIKVIPNFCTRGFKRIDKPFDAKCVKLLQIGTKYNKNVPNLIKAIEGINCELNIVGPIDEKLARLLKQYSINYINHINLSDNELVELYGKCDILTFISTWEGFGLPILEANTVGRPVITSNILSMPEVAGEAAMFVDPYNVVEIRAGIKRLIEDDELRTSFVKLGFENIKRFSLKRVANMYYEIYREINE